MTYRYDGVLKVQAEGGVRIVTLNDPDKLNAMTAPLREAWRTCGRTSCATPRRGWRSSPGRDGRRAAGRLGDNAHRLLGVPLRNPVGDQAPALA
jgi:hypothetical protein